MSPTAAHAVAPTANPTAASPAAEPAAARALRAFPAGSNGEFNLPADLVRVIAQGRGCRLRDADGRDMLDFSMGWGSVLPGHAAPEIVRAVAARAPLGTNFSTVNTESLALAEELLRIQPDASRRLRFCASGTEATMHALRLARAFTGRPLVLKFEGAYHGSNDEGVTSLFPSGRTPFPAPEPSSAGVDASATRVAPYNDADTAATIIRAHARDLACVIVEPLHRCLPPRPGFLAALRDACDRAGVLLVFDEVVTGFRLAYEGAQGYYRVPADIVAYGKALGGGLPIGAYVARADIIDRVREDIAGTPEYVWTASTLGGNPVSCAGANAALTLYRQPGVYPRLHAMGEALREGMRRALRDAGRTGKVIGDGPLAQIVFTDAEVYDYRTTIAGDRARSRAMMLGLFRENVFVNPMGTKLYLSLAHDAAGGDADAIPEFLTRLARVLRTL